MKSKLLFGEQDFEFIRDIYFGCLERLNKKEELVSQVRLFNLLKPTNKYYELNFKYVTYYYF